MCGVACVRQPLVGEWVALFESEKCMAWIMAVTTAQRVASKLVRRVAEREDLASEVLLLCLDTDAALMRRAPGQIALAAWMHGVAFNVLRHRRARERAQQQAFQEVADRELVTGSQAIVCPVTACEQRERAEFLQTAIRGLDTRCRRIAALRLAGMNLPEVSAQLHHEARIGNAMARHLWKRTVRHIRESMDAVMATSGP